MQRLLTLVLALILFGATSASAEKPLVLNWHNLVPKAEKLEHPLRHVDVKYRYDIEYLSNILYWERTGQISKVDSEYEQGVEIADQLEKDNVDYKQLIAKYEEYLDEIDRRNKTVVRDLDGKIVKIPGFALPLETAGTAITEFLLVPNIGACIHTPVPPANQMVFVKLNQSYVAKDLYEPVWITGKMKLKSAKSSITYVDGNSTVESAYTLEGISIKPYGNP